MTNPLALSRQDYTVGWICALPTEMAAAQGMLDERHSPLTQDSHDHNTYTLGRIGVHNTVLACLPAGVTGTISAAKVATQMLASFKWLRIGLMVGVGGGVPSREHDIRLGDVVVSQPRGTLGGLIQYDFGKTILEGRLQRTGSLNKPPDVLLTALANLQSRHLIECHKLSSYMSEMITKYPNTKDEFIHPGKQQDWLYEAAYDHPEEQITCSQCDTSRLIDREARLSEDPVIHYGLIASGDQVMRHGVTRDMLRRELNVLCFEMEAAGLMDNFPCLVIRGISDYADSHKSKRWQAYAAAAAAAYAKELLSVIPGNQVVSTRTAVETTEEARK
jgi:nucleoside phosphorylase